MPAAWIGAAAAVGGLALNAVNSSGAGGIPNAPTLPDQGQANSQYSGAMTGIYGAANTGQQYTNNQINNPYTSGYQGGANAAAGQYGNLASMAGGASSSLYGAGDVALGAGDAILQNGFDPQNALYDRTQQQVQDQTLAGLAATGTASSPYGAGVLGQTDSNFNINWQNAQLGREATAAQAYGGLNSTAQSDFAAGGAQGQLQANSTMMAGSMPYSTYQGIQGNDIQALLQQQQLYGNAASSAGNYLGLASGNFGNQLGQYQAYQQQGANAAAGLGQLAGYGGQLYNKYYGGGSSGNNADAWGGAGASADDGGW